jgi:hypothetical protein
MQILRNMPILRVLSLTTAAVGLAVAMAATTAVGFSQPADAGVRGSCRALLDAAARGYRGNRAALRACQIQERQVTEEMFRRYAKANAKRAKYERIIRPHMERNKLVEETLRHMSGGTIVGPLTGGHYAHYGHAKRGSHGH